MTSLYCDNCRYILIITDYFDKYVKACPLPMKSADCVAKSLYQTFSCHGAPTHIVTDQGREFVNQKSCTFDFMGFLLTRLIFTLKLQLLILQITESLNSKYNINQRITSAYDPQSNGLDERTNQTVKNFLKCV